MAEAWTRSIWRGLFEAYSAGVDPGRMDPLTIRVMEEEGISMKGYHPKHVALLAGVAFDFVVTVCDHARETCPYFSGVRGVFHQGFEDPPVLARKAETREEVLTFYRRVRDEIKEFVMFLPDFLGIDTP